MKLGVFIKEEKEYNKDFVKKIKLAEKGKNKKIDLKKYGISL